MCEELISVVVFSYNSSSTIIETLDSIYAQTYKNIELIISDDGSSDDTVKKTQRWSKSKCNRFLGSSLLRMLRILALLQI